MSSTYVKNVPMFLTLERLVAPAVLRTVVSLLVVARWWGAAVLSSAMLVSVQTVTVGREEEEL